MYMYILIPFYYWLYKKKHNYDLRVYECLYQHIIQPHATEAILDCKESVPSRLKSTLLEQHDVNDRVVYDDIVWDHSGASARVLCSYTTGRPHLAKRNKMADQVVDDIRTKKW